MEAKEKAKAIFMRCYRLTQPDLTVKDAHIKAVENGLLIVKEVQNEWDNEVGRAAKQEYWKKVETELNKMMPRSMGRLNT